MPNVPERNTILILHGSNVLQSISYFVAFLQCGPLPINTCDVVGSISNALLSIYSWDEVLQAGP